MKKQPQKRATSESFFGSPEIKKIMSNKKRRASINAKAIIMGGPLSIVRKIKKEE